MDGATLFSTARTATDNAGNVSVASNVVGPLFIDTVAPQMIAILSPTPTSFGWNNTDVDVSFGCTDAGSGVDLPLSSGVGGDGTATAEGDTPFTGTGTCYDYAGNTGTPVSVTVKIDKTAPNVNCTAPAPATYSTDVVVPCVAQDNAGGSGLAVAGDSNFSLSTSGPGTNLSTTSRSVCDKAGNCVPAGPFGPYTIDGTGPSVTLSVTDGTLGTNGWYTSDVTVHTAGTDDVLPVTCTADQFQTTDTTGATFNGSCTNGAAITTNATPLTVKLDTTKPVLDPSLPVNPVALNAVVDADPNASDATSGIASSSCEDVDTSVAGTFEIDCTAKDNAGNTQTKTISYTVLAQSTGSGGILFGNKPPLGGGYGTFAFGGGTFEQLLATSGCPSVSAVFFYNKPDGAFAVWIPGTTVSLVNQEIIGIFSATIPSGTIFTARCV